MYAYISRVSNMQRLMYGLMRDLSIILAASNPKYPERTKTLVQNRVSALTTYIGINLFNNEDSAEKMVEGYKKLLKDKFDLDREEAAKIMRDAMAEKYEQNRGRKL